MMSVNFNVTYGQLRDRIEISYGSYRFFFLVSGENHSLEEFSSDHFLSRTA